MSQVSLIRHLFKLMIVLLQVAFLKMLKICKKIIKHIYLVVLMTKDGLFMLKLENIHLYYHSILYMEKGWERISWETEIQFIPYLSGRKLYHRAELDFGILNYYNNWLQAGDFLGTLGRSKCKLLWRSTSPTRGLLLMGSIKEKYSM